MARPRYRYRRRERLTRVRPRIRAYIVARACCRYIYSCVMSARTPSRLRALIILCTRATTRYSRAGARLCTRFRAHGTFAYWLQRVCVCLGKRFSCGRAADLGLCATQLRGFWFWNVWVGVWKFKRFIGTRRSVDVVWQTGWLSEFSLRPVYCNQNDVAGPLCANV